MITTRKVSAMVKILRYIHATLFLVMIVPLICAVGELEIETYTIVIVLKCAAIIIPVIAMEATERKAPNLAVYILIGIGITAVMAGISVLPYMPMSVFDWCYSFVIMAETWMLIVVRIIDRLKKADDVLMGVEPSMFDTPKVFYSWYFIMMYVLGILFNSKLLSDISFWITIVYLITSFIYEYLTGTNRYLYLHHRTKGIPRKRLYGISTAMILLFLLICFLAIIPSMLLGSHRRYTDIRHWFDDLPASEIEIEEESSFTSTNNMEVSMEELLDLEAGQEEPSKVLEALFWVFGAGCILLVVYGIIKAIKQILKDFRNTLDENGDIIEEIMDDEAAYNENELNIRGRHLDSEAMRIRRKYKKTIKKHRKDLPGAYESPDEIEKNAGLGNDEDMKILHGQYENARYGNQIL